MKTTFIKTKDVIEIVFLHKNKIIEARLFFNNFSATHFIYFNGKSFYDEGIDGEKRKTSKDEFFNNYQNNYWLIDNMV